MTDEKHMAYLDSREYWRDECDHYSKERDTARAESAQLRADLDAEKALLARRESDYLDLARAVGMTEQPEGHNEYPAPHEAVVLAIREAWQGMAEGECFRRDLGEARADLDAARERAERATEATRWLVVYILDPRDTPEDVRRSLIEQARMALVVNMAEQDVVEQVHAARAILAAQPDAGTTATLVCNPPLECWAVVSPFVFRLHQYEQEAKEHVEREYDTRRRIGNKSRIAHLVEQPAAASAEPTTVAERVCAETVLDIARRVVDRKKAAASAEPAEPYPFALKAEMLLGQLSSKKTKPATFPDVVERVLAEVYEAGREAASAEPAPRNDLVEQCREMSKVTGYPAQDLQALVGRNIAASAELKGKKP